MKLPPDWPKAEQFTLSATCRMARPLLLGVNISKVPEGPPIYIFISYFVSFKSQAIAPLPISELAKSKVVYCGDT